MHYIDSIQFYEYRGKEVILQFQIESSRYERFKEPFTTDKYLEVCQWEFIMSKMHRTISGVCRGRDNWENKKIKLAFQDLIINYEFVDRDEGFINYEKINYDYDWIVKVTINRSSSIQNSCSVKESSSQKKRTSSSPKESNAQNNENLVIDDDDEHIHEPKKPKIDKEASVLQQTNKHNLKSRKDRNDTSKQASIMNYVSATTEGKHSKRSNEETKSQKSKEQKPTTSKDALVQINKEQLQQMNDFVARSEQEELKKQKRKEELKDYQIWNCFDMRNERIVDVIQSLEHEIDCIFENDTGLLATRSNAIINPCDITASNILSEKQSMFVLRTIEDLRTEDGKDSSEDILHNVALPRVIIELFKIHHKLTTEAAVERIKTQDEKKILFKEEFNESY